MKPIIYACGLILGSFILFQFGKYLCCDRVRVNRFRYVNLWEHVHEGRRKAIFIVDSAHGRQQGGAGGCECSPLEFENDAVICCSPAKYPKFFDVQKLTVFSFLCKNEKSYFWLKIVLPPGKFPGDAHDDKHAINFAKQRGSLGRVLLILISYLLHFLYLATATPL